jgi:soluble lytic murein transglycosylase-like protein
MVLSLCYPALGGAATIYVYEDSRGDRLISNQPRTGGGYRLLKKYSADDYFGTARRPAATADFLAPRRSAYDELILSKARQLGLEPALMKAIVHIESAFNPAAISPRGASGLMQLMPATAQRYGVTDRFNPVQSLEGGGRYMRDLLMQFNHDTRLALAAYNAGENAVERYQGVPPYDETRDYIEKVMHMLELYRKEMLGV